MIISQPELKKKIKSSKIKGWLFLALGSWVFVTTLLLIIATKIGYNTPVTLNVIVGAAAVFWGFRKLNEAKKLRGEVK